jgi:hypothetical protein
MVVRLDFKGGWPGDAENKFTKGKNRKRRKHFEYIKPLQIFETLLQLQPAS